MQASVARPMARALATLTLTATLGAGPTVPAATSPSPVQILARVTGPDARLESYAVPIRMNVRIHRLFTFHIGLSGMQYFKRPDRLAMDLHAVPAEYGKLFAELGTPLTWSRAYDLRLVSSDGERGPYHLEGTPKHACAVARMLVDVDEDPSVPLHARWTTRDGGSIDMRITEQLAGGYAFPAHAEADMAFGGYKIHAAIEYGPYVVNQAVADSVFDGSGA